MKWCIYPCPKCQRSKSGWMKDLPLISNRSRERVPDNYRQRRFGQISSPGCQTDYRDQAIKAWTIPTHGDAHTGEARFFASLPTLKFDNRPTINAVCETPCARSPNKAAAKNMSG